MDDVRFIAVKRIMQEAKELANDPSTEYSAAPLEVSQAIRHSRKSYLRGYGSLLVGQLIRGSHSEISVNMRLKMIQEWHCTLRGAPDTEFEGGLYHFRIVLPAEYPFRPPSLMMLTPSGRFETNTKVR